MSWAGLSYACAVALAIVFSVAALAKLRRHSVTTRTFAALGLWSPRVLATGVPSTELALAAALVVVPAWAGIAALAVLSGFTTFLVLAIRRGVALGCGCFGAARPAPIGRAEVVRNLVLAVAAVVAAASAGPVLPQAGDVVIVAGMGAGARALVAIVARRGPSPSATSGLPVGSTAPPLAGLRYQDHRLTLIAFVAPTCEGCDELRSSLATQVGAHLRMEVVDLDDIRAADFTAFGVRSSPFLVVVDHHGVIRARGPARTAADVSALVAG